MKHLLISTDDAQVILRNMTASGPDAERIIARLREDTGGDFEGMAAELKGYEACAACEIEGQAASCIRIPVNQTGRRLARLLARAYREIDAAPGDHIDEHVTRVLAESQAAGEPIALKFNGVRIAVRPSSKAKDIASQWWAAFRRSGPAAGTSDQSETEASDE